MKENYIMKNTFKLLSILGTAFLATIVMVLPTSCSDDDYPNNNPLVEQVSGMWWTLINQEGIYTLEGKSTPYTRVAHAFCLNEDGTGYALSSFFNDEGNAPIEFVGGEDFAPLTYTTTQDGSITLSFDKSYEKYADYYKTWSLTYANGQISCTDGQQTIQLEAATDAVVAQIQEWGKKANFAAPADNYNINDEDFTFDNWRDQEAIYIYDGVGKDVTDAKGRTGYTLVNLPWYKGDVQTNLPEGFCDDITPGNGWEWVLNRCGSRNILNNNFFAVYNKYTGILRFFYYLPYGFNAGNDHVWQVSMTDHLAQQSVWRYGLPEDKTIVDKAILGQTGEGTYMTYTTPWTNYMSDDGLVTPNAGWWAFDVNLSQTRLDEVQPNDNIRLQMRSWNTQHVSLSSTMQAAIEGSFAGNLNADVNLLQSQQIGNSASGMIFKLGGMAGNIATVIAKVMEKKYGEAFDPAITFAKAGANLAGIKTEGSHDIDGSIKGKVEGTITLGLSGNIDTEGTIRGSAPTVGIASPTFYLKDFNLKDSHLGQGAWNLKTPPVVYAIKGFSFSGLFGNYVPYFYDPNSIEIQLNPDVFPESEIESIKV